MLMATADGPTAAPLQQPPCSATTHPVCQLSTGRGAAL